MSFHKTPYFRWSVCCSLLQCSAVFTFSLALETRKRTVCRRPLGWPDRIFPSHQCFFFQCWRVVVTRLYHYKTICLYDESEQKTSTQAHLTLVEVTCHLWVILIALLYRFLAYAPAPHLGTGEPEAKVTNRQTI